MTIIPVLICGGTGSRLWPLSRESLPKQFLSFHDDAKSLFQETLLRTHGQPDFTPPIIVASSRHELHILDELCELGIEPLALILEPFGRNTAPAIALAALAAQSMGYADAPLLIMPADHVMEAPEALLAAARAGTSHAASHLLTFGITPDHAATGYGYIQRGAMLPGQSITGPALHHVDRFVEKPNRDTAETFLASGNYAWNSGIFMFTAQCYLRELAQHAASVSEPAQQAFAAAVQHQNIYHIPEKAFGACTDISIDYGVMERTTHAAVIPIHPGWSDVGGWNAVHALATHDGDHNATKGDVVLQQAKNCYVHSPHALTALVGVSDLIVVNTSDALLVSHKDATEEVKTLVGQLKKTNRKEYMHSHKVYRPWGYYDELSETPHYRVKKIMIYPGRKLSLQFHHHRSEHWVVISGTATVTRGTEQFLLHAGESTFIPVGAHHRLENAESTPLEIIEVQMGSYVGEDDIVRLEDVYGRVKA